MVVAVPVDVQAHRRCCCSTYRGNSHSGGVAARAPIQRQAGWLTGGAGGRRALIECAGRRQWPPCAAATAAAALSMPAPHSAVVQVLPAGNFVAVLCNICSTWAGVRLGFTDNISETTPTTCGVAMLVPC